MEKDELIEQFTEYLNDCGQWYVFKEWAERKGYSLADLGFDEVD